VKRASGQTLREFAVANIFEPLGMTHTQYRDDHTSVLVNRAMAYEPREKGGGYSLDISYFEQTGDGAVHTSVEDLVKWDENFYSAQIGEKEFLTKLQEQGKLNSGKILDYAKGLFIENYRGLRAVRHGGSWGGYRAELLRFPEQHFSVACLCNVGNADPEERAERVADIYLGSLMKPKERKKEEESKKGDKQDLQLPTAQLQSYAGSYWSDELGAAYVLQVLKDQLRLARVTDRAEIPRTNNFANDVLQGMANDEFRLGGTRITFHFVRDAKQNITGFTLDAGRTRGMIFVRDTSK
jgi:hypothetical protein